MPKKTSLQVGPIGEELREAELGDERLSRRLATMADRALAAPGAGFPQMVASDAELEGVYRFLSNERVTAEGILQPHFAATGDRATAEGAIVVVHDTTSFEFGGGQARVMAWVS